MSTNPERPTLSRRDLLALAAAPLASAATAAPPPPAPPGARTQMDAHNCYPYDGRWSDRISRALSAGTPLAIEQDLFWYVNPAGGPPRSLVTHGAPARGDEPTMRQYFFDRVRPIMERALREGNRGNWPLITLNLDFKSDEAEHHAAVWSLLGEYEPWLCTAEKSDDPSRVTPIAAGPLLVLTGEQDSQERDFHDIVPRGEKLRLFGAVPVTEREASTPPEVMVPRGATNYRRWWNNPWKVVEKGGQPKAGLWTPQKQQRLESLVRHAHRNGLWIRFYTLDGDSPDSLKANGWFSEYNFGSRAAAQIRWSAALQARVDYIASDHYEALARFLRDRAT